MSPFDRPFTTFYSSTIVTIQYNLLKAATNVHARNKFVNVTVISIALDYLVPFSSYFQLNNIVTLKYELEVTQGHSQWYHSKAWVRFPILTPL